MSNRTSVALRQPPLTDVDGLGAEKAEKPDDRPRERRVQPVPPHKRVVMLVTNPCVNDSRVIRSAEAVAAAGYDVTVLATAAKGVARSESRNGVAYQRLSSQGRRVPYTPRPRCDQPRPGPLRNACRYVGAMMAGPLIQIARVLTSRHALFVNVLMSIVIASAVAWLLNFIDQNELMKKPYASVAVFLSVSFFWFLFTCRNKISEKFFWSASKKWFGHIKNVISKHAAASVMPFHYARLFVPHIVALKADIIHAHDFATLASGVMGARRTGARLIYDSHELEVHRNARRSRFDRWLCQWFEQHYIRRADAVVTVCDSIANHLQRAYGIARPAVVINAPAESSAYPHNVRADLGLAADVPLAIYVGRITIGRGIEETIRALVHLPRFHLVLLGSVNPPTLEAALAVAEAENVSERLHVLKPVPPEAVVPYIRTADVSIVAIQNVCLSYFYCLPNKLIESAIARLPMVVSDFPELRRFISLSGCGLTMNEKDPADIARATVEVYAQRHRLRPDEQRLALIEQHYGWETQRRILVSLYERLAPAPATALKKAPM